MKQPSLVKVGGECALRAPTQILLDEARLPLHVHLLHVSCGVAVVSAGRFPDADKIQRYQAKKALRNQASELDEASLIGS